MAYALLLLAAASVAQAHFGLEYPVWRASTLGSSRNNSYSQWTQPCAGVPGNLTDKPVTPWPLTGGSLKLDLHHPWTYVFVNLGLGSDVSNFNYTLTNPFWNETGNGTLCIPKLALPADLQVSEGAHGSLQVVTLGDDGNALYNCADIVFTANATALQGDDCKNSTGVSVSVVAAGAAAGGSTGGSAGGSSNSTGGTKGNAGSVMGVNVAAMSSIVTLAMMFALGMSV